MSGKREGVCLRIVIEMYEQDRPPYVFKRLEGNGYIFIRLNYNG